MMGFDDEEGAAAAYPRGPGLTHDTSSKCEEISDWGEGPQHIRGVR
jgi:hypothetical protein